jgi:hypothetical protein
MMVRRKKKRRQRREGQTLALCVVVAARWRNGEEMPPLEVEVEKETTMSCPS